MKIFVAFLVLLCLSLAFSLPLPGAAFADEVQIGTVKTVKGKAYIVSGGQETLATVGAAVRQNDTLKTASDGAVGVTFVDNTTLSLGPKSELAVTSYIFQPRVDKFSFVAQLTKGSFMFVSGLIAKLSPSSVALQTPVGTLGVRGTRFLVDVD